MKPGTRLGHYELLEAVGKGGMGEVWRARDTRLGRDVAIKLLTPGRLSDPSARALFRREAQTLSQLNHPNVQTVHDFDSEGEVDFLVTEFVPGQTLSDRLEEGPLPSDEVLRLGAQLCAGLRAAHESGIVHRDLKPANLRVEPDGRLRILDFGLAKLIEPASESATTLTRLETGPFAGTPLYMSPEQRAGRPADARSDIYAVGLVLRELLTGRADGGTLPSPKLARVIRKCLEEAPSDRYASAEVLATALRAAQRSSRGRWATAAALVLALGGVGSALLLPTRPTNSVPSVVALPSELLGPSPEQFLSEAFPNTISTTLAQLEGLEVKLPPSALELEPLRGDLARIGRAFEVSALLLSTVTADADRLVLNVKLVDATTRQIAWSDEYSGASTDYLSLVRRAAEGVSQHLGATVPAALQHDPDAELAYQRGVYHGRRFRHTFRTEDFEAARVAFDEALALDPELADAAAGLAWLHNDRRTAGIDPDSAIEEAEAWSHRAIEIDPKNARAWALLAWIDAERRPPGETLTRQAVRAASLAPRYMGAQFHLGRDYVSCSLSATAFREASRLDPLSIFSRASLAVALACLNRFDDAFEQLERARELEEDAPFTALVEVALLHRAGRLEQAAPVLERLDALSVQGRIHRDTVALFHDEHAAVRAESTEGRAAFERLVKAATHEGVPGGRLWGAGSVQAFAANGRVALARELVRRLEAAGIVNAYDFLILNPQMSWIKQDPELASILEKARATTTKRVELLTEARAAGELPPYLEEPLDELRALLDR